MNSPSYPTPEPTRSLPARLLREPLVHFVLIGALLYVVYAALNPSSGTSFNTNRIVLTENDLKQITIAWRAQGRPQPTPEQMVSLIETKVREEILFREALALGLDKDDTIIKRRLAQKMDFLAEDLSTLADPKPEELKAWFAQNLDRFELSPRVTFQHLYFSPDKRGARARDDAARALAKPGGKPDPAAADAFMFQDRYADRSTEQIAGFFGPPFAKAVAGLKVGAWTGPVESGYGWHLVLLEEITPGRVPAFEEMEPLIKQEWIAVQREESKKKMYEAMRARYEVVITESSDAKASKAGERAPAPKATL